MQTNEVELLNNILELNNKFTQFLSSIKLQVEQIHSKIQDNDTTFFIENGDISDKLHKLYNPGKIDLLVQDIENNSCDIEQILSQCCETHNFIDDYIDIDIDKHIKISYCSRCHVSKK
jgi:hypothetical protein